MFGRLEDARRDQGQTHASVPQGEGEGYRAALLELVETNSEMLRKAHFSSSDMI